MADLILASASPQRRAILAQAGFDFTVEIPAGVEELTDGAPEELVLENARRKARPVAARRPGATIVACDTEVALDGRALGKPVDAAAARALLDDLSGRAHTVVSGLCVVTEGGEERQASSATEVRFRALPAALLDWYVASGEWRERAGGYAIQGRGAALVEGIAGDYLNVVGLPLVTLLSLLPEYLAERAFLPR